MALNFELVYKNLSIKTRGKRTLVSECTGIFASSRIYTLLGDSNAGKSSFIRALCKKLPQSQIPDGDVFINSHNLSQQFATAFTGLVDQNYEMYEFLTVEECLDFYEKCLKDTSVTPRIEESKDEMLNYQISDVKKAGALVTTQYKKNISKMNALNFKKKKTGECKSLVPYNDGRTVKNWLINAFSLHNILQSPIRTLTSSQKLSVAVAIELLLGKRFICIDGFLDSLSINDFTVFYSKLRQIAAELSVCFITATNLFEDRRLEIVDDLMFLCNGYVIYRGEFSHCVEYFEERFPNDVILREEDFYYSRRGGKAVWDGQKYIYISEIGKNPIKCLENKLIVNQSPTTATNINDNHISDVQFPDFNENQDSDYLNNSNDGSDINETRSDINTMIQNMNSVRKSQFDDQNSNKKAKILKNLISVDFSTPDILIKTLERNRKMAKEWQSCESQHSPKLYRPPKEAMQTKLGQIYALLKVNLRGILRNLQWKDLIFRFGEIAFYGIAMFSYVFFICDKDDFVNLSKDDMRQRYEEFIATKNLNVFDPTAWAIASGLHFLYFSLNISSVLKRFPGIIQKEIGLKIHNFWTVMLIDLLLNAPVLIIRYIFMLILSIIYTGMGFKRYLVLFLVHTKVSILFMVLNTFFACVNNQISFQYSYLFLNVKALPVLALVARLTTKWFVSDFINCTLGTIHDVITVQCSYQKIPYWVTMVAFIYILSTIIYFIFQNMNLTYVKYPKQMKLNR